MRVIERRRPGRTARTVSLMVVVALAAALGVVTTGAGAAPDAPAVSSRASAAFRMPLLRLRPHLVAQAARELGSRPARPEAARAPVFSTALQAGATPCGSTPGLLCSQVVVPLDRSGVVPGTITLEVETLPPVGQSRGAMFLIAGGPGQGSASVFDLRDPVAASLYQFLFPGYTLVAFDNRGTGRSGLLTCPGLQGYYPISEEEARVGACAAIIGPNRIFYATRDHAEDIDAVRASLGVAKVGLWGTSYGTKLAVAYALAHPGQVERLLLDSVVPTDLDDPYRANSLREMPKAFADLCGSGACRAATPDFGGDVAALANQLDAKPITGKVRQVNGSLKTERIAGVDLLSLVIDADLNPGLAVQLPAAVRAARKGEVQALLRLFELDLVEGSFAPEDLSGGLFAATVCDDGPFPYATDSPVAGRRAAYLAAASALPAGSFGPFGNWAAQIGNGHFCLGWPPPVGASPLGAGPLPDVPVLAVNGGFDMRTPTASAVAVISKFRQGRLLVVPGVGHSVIGADPSFCAARAVREWIQSGTVPASCARPGVLLNPIAAYPQPKRKRPAGPAETLAIAAKTIREAQALWLMTGAPGSRVAGIHGGRIVFTAPRAFRLERYAIVPGVELSGTIRYVKFAAPLEFDGIVTVGGAMAAPGVLGLSGASLGGALGGALVGR